METTMSEHKLIELRTNVDELSAPYCGDDSWWEQVPAFTIPQTLPNGVAMVVNVKGPKADNGHEKFVRYIRAFNVETGTVTDRIDYLVDADHPCFLEAKIEGIEVTSEGDETLVKAPVVEIVE